MIAPTMSPRARRAFAAELHRRREALAASLTGLDAADDRRAFAGWLLTRLVFVGCLLRCGALDASVLRAQSQRLPGTCYRAFLRPLLVPAVVGELIPPHALEQGAPIDLPDEACAALLGFLQAWWPQLDGAALSDANEQFSSQKPTGAYYTAPDVAAYICRATIIPALFDRARLSLAPLDLPATVECFIHPEAAQPALLANESERERHARLARHERLLAHARAGGIASINDAISANLDLPRLLVALIERLDAPAVNAFYEHLSQLRVLDLTCGAGALLVAALHTLQPIYAAVFARMDELIAQRAPYETTFGHITAEMQRRRENNSYLSASAPLRLCDECFTAERNVATRHIIANNLHGVDLSDEAAAVCRLRLFLELAEVSPVGSPLLEAAIAAGNALVGYGWRDGTPEALSRELAGEYGIAPNDELAYRKWLASHRPLHWGAAFPSARAQGGFDAVVGNPPYVAFGARRGEYSVRGYRTAAGGNLYALAVERALALLRPGGRCGVVVPVASVATAGMAALQELYAECAQWHSHYAVRPGKLFEGADMNLTISLLATRPKAPEQHSTSYRRWSARGGERAQLFATLAYAPTPRLAGMGGAFPKLGDPVAARILERMLSHRKQLGNYASPEGATIYYHSGGRYWRKALWERRSSHFKPLCVRPAVAPLAFALLNSQLFYWYWIAHSNCMDVVSREVHTMPVFDLESADAAPFATLNERLLQAYAEGSRIRQRRGERISVEETNVDSRRAKPIIDALDTLLAHGYGFAGDELDFIVNYDIKYRS